MKLIYVTSGGDYGAAAFTDNHKRQTVASIIERIESGENLDKDFDEEAYEDEYTVEVMTFADVDPLFVEFIRNVIQDYDDSKNHNFWLETETV